MTGMPAATQRILRVRREYNAWVATETMEDYALRFAPRSFRKWSEARVAATALGSISFLALEAIGGAVMVGYGFTHAYVGEHDAIATTGAVQSGRDAFRMAGVTPADIDVAELYDCFTITVIAELEDLGFCPKGEGGRFVEGGRIEMRDSTCPALHAQLQATENATLVIDTIMVSEPNAFFQGNVPLSEQAHYSERIRQRLLPPGSRLPSVREGARPRHSSKKRGLLRSQPLLPMS